MDDELNEVRIDKAIGSRPMATSSDRFEMSGKDFFAKYTSSLGKNAQRRAKYRYQNGRDGAGSKQLSTTVSAYDVLEAVEPPHNIEQLAELYDKSPWNYAAVNAKAANVVGLGFRLEPSNQMQSKLDSIDGKKLERARKKIEIARRGMEDWLESLNDNDLFLQTLLKAYIDYQATGNGYIEIGRIPVGKNKGDIGYVGHIPSATVRVRKFHDGFVQMVEGKVKFFRNFGDTKTSDPLESDASPNEIIHIKNYTPTNTYYGVPDIIPAMNAVAGSEFASRYNLDFFEHRTAPRYVVLAKGANLSATSQAQILEFLQSGLKGKNHRSIYVPLPPDRDGTKSEITFHAVENGIQDSSFENYRESNRDEILAVHRVPLTKLGISKAGGSASAIDFDKTFKEVVCRPEQDILEKRVNAIIKEKTDIFTIEFNELTLTDALAQSQIDERYLRLQTLLPNEARKHMGLGPIKGGDKAVDLSPQKEADQKATAKQSRERDSKRKNSATDGNSQPRNPEGEGRAPGTE